MQNQQQREETKERVMTTLEFQEKAERIEKALAEAGNLRKQISDKISNTEELNLRDLIDFLIDDCDVDIDHKVYWKVRRMDL
mgnify:CR=1 FL=1